MDPDIESFIIDSTIEDKYLQVLIEGLATVKVNDEQKQQAMLIVEGHQDNKNTEGTQGVTMSMAKSVNSEITDPMSVLTGLTKNSKSGKRAEWDEITLAREHDKTIVACGMLPFYHGMPSDHCALYVDLNIDYLFTNAYVDIGIHTYKRFTTGQAKKCDKYLFLLEKYLEENRVIKKVQELQKKCINILTTKKEIWINL